MNIFNNTLKNSVLNWLDCLQQLEQEQENLGTTLDEVQRMIELKKEIKHCNVVLLGLGQVCEIAGVEEIVLSNPSSI